MKYSLKSICKILFLCSVIIFKANAQKKKNNSANNLGEFGKGILLNKGVNDPHIHIFNNKAYLFASHDAGVGNKEYTMDFWNIYSSEDLVNWKKEFVLKPEDTYIGKPISKCFAIDGATRNGKYYFYFSNFNKSTGVAISDKPEGPYKDALGKALIPETLKGTKNYDPTIFIDDDEKHYLIYGFTGWGKYYQIVELNEDMVSVKTKPKNLVVKDDVLQNDASYLHKHNSTYYLSSHKGKYATSQNLYGPYEYRGRVEADGDHGTYFMWNNQTYYTAGGWQSPYFRYTYICYAHYKDNGEIVAKRYIKGDYELGVGRYDVDFGKIEAECFFASSNSIEKRENASGFEMRNIKNGDFLYYPKVFNIPKNAQIKFRYSSNNSPSTIVKIYKNNNKGKLLATCKLESTKGWENYKITTCKLPKIRKPINLFFEFDGSEKEILRLDWFEISSE